MKKSKIVNRKSKIVNLKSKIVNRKLKIALLSIALLLCWVCLPTKAWGAITGTGTATDP